MHVWSESKSFVDFIYHRSVFSLLRLRWSVKNFWKKIKSKFYHRDVAAEQRPQKRALITACFHKVVSKHWSSECSLNYLWRSNKCHYGSSRRHLFQRRPTFGMSFPGQEDQGTFYLNAFHSQFCIEIDSINIIEN